MFSVPAFTLLFVLTPSIILAHTLPIFFVQSTFQGPSRAQNLHRKLYQKDGEPTYVDSRLIIRGPNNSTTFELDTHSGGIWSADNTRLWNTSHAKHPSEFVEANKTCRDAAEDLIKKYKLVPHTEESSPVTFEFAGISGTQLSNENGHANGSKFNREEFQLDISANYIAKVKVPGQGNLPVIGGGGNFQFTFEQNSRLIGYHGVWRDVQGKGVDYPVIPQIESDSQYKNATSSLNILNFKSTLAYYSAPFGTVQNYLYPVYIYHATAKFGNETVQLRETLLPATTFLLEPQTLPLKPNCAAPIEKNSKPTHPSKSRRSALIPRQSKTWGFGTEWLGVPWGLPGSQANAAGVSNLLFDGLFGGVFGGLFGGGAQWTQKFNWGNNLVWETDWDAEDSVWVDSADLVFYTGHANGNGWATATPTNDAFVHHEVVGTFPQIPGNLWGHENLKWLVIAACGPHQDDRIVAGGGNAFDRWRGAFDGLHVFMGYATESIDNTGEGSGIVKYAMGGDTLVNSWFRAAKEVQRRGVWVTAMWSGNSGQDHLPGHGGMETDPPISTQRWLLWSQV